jgi:hypothetical protein
VRFPQIAVSLVFIVAVTLPLAAQSPNGSMNGLVLDPSDRVITGADILVINDVTGVKYSSKTNDQGIYVVPDLPPGPYRLQVSKVGFKTLIKPNIVLSVQDALSINFTLPVGGAFESLTVEGGAPLVNTESAAVSAVIDRKFVENMPLNGRSFQDLISMTPGVVTQSPQTGGQTIGSNGDFSVNGQRTESNVYTVDGVTGNIGAGTGTGFPGPANGGTIAASTALGTTQSLISVDALQEFRVQSSTYSAEFGRSPGGQFSLVTRSGTNDLHGSVFDYLRNNFFDANDWFNDHYGTRANALRQNDFGGTLGGPVVIPGVYNGRNSTFFFVSYEGLRLTQPQAATIQYVPDHYLRLQAPAAIQPILNAFPIQNGVDYGTQADPSLAQFIEPYSLPSQVDALSVRVDHTFGAKLAVFFRFGDTPSSTSSRLLSAVQQQQLHTKTFTFGASSRLSSSGTNDFRFGYSSTSSRTQGTLDGFGGATPLNLADAMGADYGPSSYVNPFIFVSGVGTSSLATGLSDNRARQWNALDTYSWLAGHHQVKVGIDYRRIASPLDPPSPYTLVEFGSANSVVANSADFAFLVQYLSSEPVFNEIAAFAQDQWQLSPGVSLSYGLRWELDPAPSEASGNDAYTLLGSIADPSSLKLAPHGTRLWKTPWFNFAPRLGLAWQTHKSKTGWETVVRGGGGVFFDTDNRLAAKGFNAFGFSAVQFFLSQPLPLTAANFNFPSPTALPTTSPVVAFPSHLQLPYTLQWNAAIEQGLGPNQTLTISYVGASGRRLVQTQEVSVASGNPDFSQVFILQSGVTSNYNALQLRFQRTMGHGLNALASYTWSHCLDFGSTDSSFPATRGNCDFDVRHNFQAGASWDLPQRQVLGPLGAVLTGWGVDGRVMARTAFPVPLQGNPITDPATGTVNYGGLNLLPHQSIYVHGSQYPGNRAINPAAFSLPPSGQFGDAPRNFVRGFGAWQLNLALRREFRLHERLSLQFRAEAFNVLNHPNFGYIDPTLTDATFGQATQMLNSSLSTMAAQYQQGGARSLQFALKLVF